MLKPTNGATCGMLNARHYAVHMDFLMLMGIPDSRIPFYVLVSYIPCSASTSVIGNHVSLFATNWYCRPQTSPLSARLCSSSSVEGCDLTSYPAPTPLKALSPLVFIMP